MKIYWYAPFENAYELDVAEHVARPNDQLVVQALATRFGASLPPRDSLDVRRNLPEPAGESGPPASRWRRSKVAFERTGRRATLLRDDRYDLVHIHTFNMFTDWGALRLLRRRCETLILSVHNVRPHEQRGPRAVETRLHKAGYGSCDHIVVTDPTLREQLVVEFRVPRSRTSVIPLPIQGVSKVNSASTSPTREFLFFGTFRHNKGIEQVLAAMRLIGPETDFVLRFAGRGKAELETLVRDAAESDPRIIAEVGWVSPDRQAELFQNAWAVVLPYTSFDAQSGVLRDAYAYRVPVIATDIGALGRAVRDDGSGWLVSPNDPAEFARAMVDAAANAETRAGYVKSLEPLGAAATFALVGKQTRALYDEIHPARPRG